MQFRESRQISGAKTAYNESGAAAVVAPLFAVPGNAPRMFPAVTAVQCVLNAFPVRFRRVYALCGIRILRLYQNAGNVP